MPRRKRCAFESGEWAMPCLAVGCWLLAAGCWLWVVEFVLEGVLAPVVEVEAEVAFVAAPVPEAVVAFEPLAVGCWLLAVDLPHSTSSSNRFRDEVVCYCYF